MGAKNNIEEEVINLVEQYGYKVRVLYDNSLLVTSKYSEWYVINKGNYYLLRHYSNNSEKIRFHIQKNRGNQKLKFDSLHKVFKYIYNHDRADIIKKNRVPYRIERLFHLIEKVK